jgi:putative transposase
VHLVFVTKYRREVFTKEILDDLRPMLASVCRDFEAELVEFDGEDDHVHLLVNYPPKVCFQSGQQPKRRFQPHDSEEELPEHPQEAMGRYYGRLPTLPVAAVAHRLPLSGSTSNSSKHHTRRTKPTASPSALLTP